jgi:hypothetical protein
MGYPSKGTKKDKRLAENKKPATVRKPAKPIRRNY